ncbi:siderophore-interacting protein [Methylorubrum sp. SB2]|uniref:siderophore-interacting protein n=1 Tax=Methylorubrum subtropicum TaxID=3138812 RepID=UPI00313CAC35
MLFSEATVALADPQRLTTDLVEHLSAHDVAHARHGARVVLQLGAGTGSLEPVGERLRVRVEAPDEGGLEMLRALLAANIVDFSEGEEPVIAWSGFTAGAPTFANFRELQLMSSEALTPRLRRLTFTGRDLDRFASADDLHVRLYLPPPGVTRPEWPRPGPDGRTLWPEAPNCPEVRYYTIRRASPDTVAIDFVLHDDPGPGARFAVEARPGAICGIAGPMGRAAPPAAWTLLAGDETALPAIARLLEAMPRHARGVVLIEADGAEAGYPLAAPEGVSLRWLDRAPESTLVAAIRALDFPAGDDLFVWAGCEAGAARALRKHLRSERGLTREQHLVVGYWERARAPAA